MPVDPGGAEAEALARFLHVIGRLKTLPRTGWLHAGVPLAQVESVADHSFRTALLAWLAAASHPDLDRERVLKLALVHDLAEALAGDPTPYDPAEIPAESDAAARRSFLNRRHVRSEARRAAKRAAEAAAMARLLASLPVALAAELRALWEEAEARETAEARFVKECDTLERFLQSREYLAVDPTLPMDSFAADVEESIGDPGLRSLRDAAREAATGRSDRANADTHTATPRLNEAETPSRSSGPPAPRRPTVSRRGRR